MDEVQLHGSFRCESPGGPSLGSGELHVWAVPLLGCSERYGALLSSAETDRASRFRVVDHRRRYAISHGALRAILAGYLGADAQALHFETGARGKPRLSAHPALHFNLSHSGQLALIALGAIEVGVDVEKQRHLESLREIARRHFSAAEVEELEAAPAAAQLQAFYRCWTRKEAYVKALGHGLTLALDVFDVSIGEDVRFVAFRTTGESPADWTLADVSPGADYTGAVAARRPGLHVRTFALAGG